MPSSKRSFEDRLDHVKAVEGVLVRGGRQRDVFRVVGAMFPDLTRKQMMRDVYLVRRRWRKEAARVRETPGEQFGKAHARLELIFARAIGRDEDGLALKAEHQRCKLLNLYPGKTVVVKEAPRRDGVEHMTDAELLEAIRAGGGVSPGVRRLDDIPREDLDRIAAGGRAGAMTYADLEMMDPRAVAAPGDDN